jgi:hypothetical protein
VTYTAKDHADAVQRYGADSRGHLSLVALIEGGHGSGLVLSSVSDRPDVLGLAAIDSQGGQAGLALSVPEVTAARDALTAWLETPTPPEPGTCGHIGPRGRPCTDPAGHAGDDLTGESHGDGSVFRWLVRPPDRFPETDVTVPPPL